METKPTFSHFRTSHVADLPLGQDLLGVEYKRGGVGPDGIDCLGIPRLLAQRHFNVDIPDPNDYAGLIAYTTAWDRIEEPSELLDVAFGQWHGENGLFTFVGAGFILTASPSAGCFFLDAEHVPDNVRYYRFKD